ncbi:hypothetical protein BGW80DRAFT_1129202, partial [Lactifluus volemus]
CASGSCQASDSQFRCRDCFGNRLYCQPCIVKGHQSLPLHRIEEWKETHFKATSLRQLGQHIQLGHGGLPCDFRTQARGHKDFVVLDTNGIHLVNISFCGCLGAATHCDQLLEVGWWPSTPLEPQTAATMSALRSFHITNLQGHVSPTDFYRCLEQTT